MKKNTVFILVSFFGAMGIIIFLLIRSLLIDSVAFQPLEYHFVPPEKNIPIEKRIEIEKKFSEFLKNNQNIFRIRTKLSNVVYYGSCFLIENSVFVTANHLVEEFFESQIFVNQWEPVNLISISYTKDIAFVKLKNTNYQIKDRLKFKSIKDIFDEFKDQKFVPLEKLLVGMKCMSEEKPRILIGKLFSWNPVKETFSYSIMQNSEGCSGAPIFTYDGYIIGIHQLQGGTLGQATEISKVLNDKKLP